MENASLKSLRACFLEDHPKVIVLFSHWTSANAVELGNESATADEIVAAVPEDFIGIIDLCVCHPRTLSVALAVQRPRCLVRSQDNAATVAFWLIFYGLVIDLLHLKRFSYLQAMEQAIISLDSARTFDGGVK